MQSCNCRFNTDKTLDVSECPTHRPLSKRIEELEKLVTAYKGLVGSMTYANTPRKQQEVLNQLHALRENKDDA